ncbi:uncharacterized protein LOC123015239 [Tribolium madens]|uniref:uncharacterized protein LOC123015239 n=1 Tax=Tribolium madens TaxID=41895 RepID=UPI001CF76490|nr:uncharacterized protein LOC123015239 [Tribolium madens]
MKISFIVLLGGFCTCTVVLASNELGNHAVADKLQTKDVVKVLSKIIFHEQKARDSGLASRQHEIQPRFFIIPLIWSLTKMIDYGKEVVEFHKRNKRMASTRKGRYAKHKTNTKMVPSDKEKIHENDKKNNKKMTSKIYKKKICSNTRKSKKRMLSPPGISED